MKSAKPHHERGDAPRFTKQKRDFDNQSPGGDCATDSSNMNDTNPLVLQHPSARPFVIRRQSDESTDSPHLTASDSTGSTTAKRCQLLELPAELREDIWIHAVIEWQPAADEGDGAIKPMLVKRPIRMDRFNKILPPAITRVSHQIRAESLHLYYQNNIFECWRPLLWNLNWTRSTFVSWLDTLGPRKIAWLRHLVLLYKREGELEYDLKALSEEGVHLPPDGVIVYKQELSEYEMCFEELGLPRHFGKKTYVDRF